MALDTQGVPQLEVEAVIGFSGHVSSGLWVHPDREHLIYPLGSTVILKKIKDGKQEFLHGHTNNVSCISVSKSGSYIASGQVNFMGFEALMIIWDYAERTIYAQLALHKTKVEALAFSPNNKYLVSLGGQDDGSLVVFDIETKHVICGNPASARTAGQSLTLQYSNTNDNIFVSAGSGTLLVWELDIIKKKIQPMECQIGKLRRTVKCIAVDEDDNFVYCGTTSGDILKINMKSGILNCSGPVKNKYVRGVLALKILNNGCLLVGSGSGTLGLCSSTAFKSLKEVQLEKGVTSIALRGEGQQFFVGTDTAQMFHFSYEDFRPELVSTGHHSPITDIATIFGTSELFATCSKEDIRVWHINKPKELLRVTVPNVTCNCLHIMADGRSIVSGWNDSNIRVFAPESGRIMLIIHNAHMLGVTALTGTSCCTRLITGGEKGKVHVWELQPRGHRMVETLYGHKTTVTCIQIKRDDKECVTACSDGTCFVWDLVRFVSLQMVTANTQVRAMCYHPEEYQIITSGADRKIAYWELYDCSAIRKLEASQSGAINSMHMSQDGKYFVTGGDDKLLKVWDYNEGVVTHVGICHGGSITSIRLCSDNRTLISASADGAIVRWTFPHPSSS